ncbi:TlpA disulfide reductase family protein [Sphingobacterium sp. SGR-19]|uniref:TlpA disulfide reductase family protein n=1 Tax=Sphingobacterium sp. SGR-19 TaxID=2710886 RepID=UPI0013ED2888|nr:TlpA disulfide reductase family protein [Sphingobacterium sp. SGR-19]NGM66563.1 AhpC/TSA family protein [Sphingobacterium sp. SGR-19]
MKLTHIWIFITLLCGPVASFSQSGNFTIKGKANPRHNNKFIKLYYVNDTTKITDSVMVKNGRFKLKGHILSPTIGKLGIQDGQTVDFIDLFLSKGSIRVSAKDSIRYADISGTKMVEEHERLAKQIRPSETKLFDALNTFKKMPEGEEKKAYITKLIPEISKQHRAKQQIVHEFVTENPTSYVSLYYLDKTALGRLANYETTYPYYEKLSATLKETALGKQLEERLLSAKGELTGTAFKDFSSTTPEGKALSLNEVISKNKYTLVDFWASWCGPCRKENPHVVETFNAFKDKGFTVLSVSLDTDANRWKAAIEQDGMPWYHVSSLKGWKEPAAALYGVRAIPQNVLIDGQGKIVATNLRGETLFNKIQELLK